jgi:hypothetical protein
MSVEAAAGAVLDCATDKIIPIVEGLMREYQIDPDDCLLIGEGGGAGSLIPYVSERTRLRHEISKDAEVISSIGVALALVRDVIERVIPHPKPEDLQAIRREALQAAVRLGADATSVEVTIEIDRQTHRVRATAMGAAEMHVKDPGGSISEREARGIAARSMDLTADTLRLAAETPGLRIYQAPGEDLAAVRAVDWEGAVRVRRSRALVSSTSVGAAKDAVNHLWVATAGNASGRAAVPGLFLMYERHVIDLSGVETVEQAVALAASELEDLTDDAPVALIGVPPGQAV